MSIKKPQRHNAVNNSLSRQFAVQWKTLIGFIVLAVLIAVSLSATAKAKRAEAKTPVQLASVSIAASRLHRA